MNNARRIASSLQEGQIIDAKEVSSGLWSIGEVIRIDDEKKEAMIHLLFHPRECDFWVKIHDDSLETYIAPYGTRAFVFPISGSTNSTMGAAEKFQKVDAFYAKATVWLEAEIIDVKHTVNLDGNRHSMVRVHFHKFESRNDVWFPQKSSLIKPFGTETRKGHPDAKRLPGREFYMNHSSNIGESFMKTSNNKALISYDDDDEEEEDYDDLDENGLPKNKDIKTKEHANNQENSSLQKQQHQKHEEHHHQQNHEEQQERIRQYREALGVLKCRLVSIQGDGNCLFRTVSHQIYGDENFHQLVRMRCLDYMVQERSYFEPFIARTSISINTDSKLDAFTRYIEWKRKDAIWGDDIEIQALCEIYDRPAEIYAYHPKLGAKMLKTFHEDNSLSSSSSSSSKISRVPMRISFYGGGHFDSIIGPGFQGALLPQNSVGQVEELRIQMASKRKLQRQQQNSSDQEQKEFEQVLNLSRERYRNGQDIQSVLTESLTLAEEEETKRVETVLKTSLEERILEEEKKAMVVSDVQATEDIALQEALKLSKAEAISIPMVFDDYDEKKQLEWALKESVYPFNSFNASPPFPMNEEEVDDDEDNLLRLAIMQSMQENN